MGALLNLLADRKVLVSDGAWGTMLQARGLTPQQCPEEWNVSHAQDVKSVAAEYARAGSDLVLTNTFGGSATKLAKMGFRDKVREFNLAGARNSLQGAPDALIVGSVGPTGDFLQPLGTATADEMEAVFCEQIGALLEAGLKVICIETMTAVEEALAAVRAARKLDPELDIITTFTFDATPNGPRTMMGVDPQQVVEELPAAGANVLGANCGNGIEQMTNITNEFRKHTNLPILIHANAGLPELVDGRTVFRQSPEAMAAHTRALLDAGANIIGGCCGTTPEHITAMKTALNA
ncbi:MAG: homocysteine S-methyltransferase family protein [Phycisphaerae bacterium]|nr:homocysteine S-methyltransferase family protein [Phycisphaerae bacterium]